MSLILEKEDWQFICAHLEPTKISYDKAKSDINIHHKRNDHILSIMRNLSFMDSMIYKKEYFDKIQSNIITDRTKISFYKYTPIPNSFFDEVAEFMQGKVDLKKEVTSMLLLLCDNDITKTGQSNIVSYLQKKDSNFINYLGDLALGHQLRNNVFNWVGKISNDTSKKNKESFNAPEWFMNLILTTESFPQQVKNQNFNEYKPFFDGLLFFKKEQLKKIIDKHDNNLSKIPAYNEWKKKLPEDIQKNFDFDEFTSDTKIKITRSIKFQLTDLMNKDKQSHLKVNKDLMLFSKKFFDYIREKHPEVTTLENLNHMATHDQDVKTDKRYNFMQEVDLSSKDIHEYIREMDIKEENIKKDILNLKNFLRQNPDDIKNLLSGEFSIIDEKMSCLQLHNNLENHLNKITSTGEENNNEVERFKI